MGDDEYDGLGTERSTDSLSYGGWYDLGDSIPCKARGALAPKVWFPTGAADSPTSRHSNPKSIVIILVERSLYLRGNNLDYQPGLSRPILASSSNVSH